MCHHYRSSHGRSPTKCHHYTRTHYAHTITRGAPSARALSTQSCSTLRSTGCSETAHSSDRARQVCHCARGLGPWGRAPRVPGAPQAHLESNCGCGCWTCRVAVLDSTPSVSGQWAGAQSGFCVGLNVCVGSLASKRKEGESASSFFNLLTTCFSACDVHRSSIFTDVTVTQRGVSCEVSCSPSGSYNYRVSFIVYTSRASLTPHAPISPRLGPRSAPRSTPSSQPLPLRSPSLRAHRIRKLKREEAG